MGDSHCSLVWGSKVAADASDGTAVAVIGGDTSVLSSPDGALVAWARRMALDPNSAGRSGGRDRFRATRGVVTRRSRAPSAYRDSPRLKGNPHE